MTGQNEKTAQDALRKAELFELIVESSTSFAIFTTDMIGSTTSWNVGAERLFGYTDEDMLGSSADTIFVAEDRADGAPERERRTALEVGRAQDERWHQRKDGSQFWASGLLMPLEDGSGFVKICQDRSEEHASEEGLRINEERFRVLATSIPQLVFRTQPNGDRTWPSPQWIDFTGLSFEASLGRGWLAAVHPDDREKTMNAWDEAIRTGEYYAEQRVRRSADGEYRWHQTRARPVLGEALEGDWVGTMTDIHDLRGFQDRQQVLMAELQHRTRNLLAVVQAIVRQTVRKSDSLDSFVSEFESRLRALSRVQGLLARSDHQAIDLRSLVEAELNAHGGAETDADRVMIEGPPVALPATSSQTLALALHELATNAAKYGALAQPSGKLKVGWSFDAKSEETIVDLLWEETGVEMPDSATPRRKGYGSELIGRALPYQLNAKTNLEFGPGGVRCAIRIPVGTNGQAISRD